MFPDKETKEGLSHSKGNYFLKYFFPGILLIVCAFWAGTLRNAIFALVGFLSFFVMGVTLIREGWKQTKNHEQKPSDNRPETTDKIS
jgi:predicted phage tail protein